MASGISVKMGVTGVAQFKQGMKESQAAVKNLDQQLKLNEAQLKLNGNEELALKNKTELLTKQIEEQKNVVKQAQSALEAMQRNGVSRTSVEFQKMQQQVYKASTDLMTMQNELQNVGESGEEAQSGVSHMNQALQRIGTNVSFQSVTEGIEKITGTLEKAATAAWNLGKKIVQATLGGAAWADELQTEADVWQIPAEKLYRMRETARIIDTDAETILQAQDKLKKGREESGKEFMGSLAYLHIDPNGMSDIDLFWKAGEAIAALGKEEDKVHYAQTLFGKSWRELIPLFSAGREEYEKTYEAWDWIGDEQLEKLTTLDDKLQEFQSELQSVQLQFQAQMAEVLTPVMETLTGLLKEFNTYLQSEDGQQMLASLGEAISGLFEDITKIDPETVINGIKDAINGVKKGLDWIKRNKDGIKTAIEAIGIAFGTLKLASLAGNIGRIVTGLRGLFGGGGGSQGNPLDITTAGRPGGSYSNPVPTTQSGGFFVGVGNALNSILSNGAAAITANGGMNALAMLPYVIQDFTTFGQTLFHGGTVGEAVGNSWETIKASASEGLQNFTDYFSKDLQSGMWGIIGVKDAEDLEWKMEHGAENAQRAIFGSGDQFQYVPTEEGLARAALRLLEAERKENAQPMERMTQVAGEMSATISPMTESSNNMTAAANSLMDLPAMIQTAVVNGISNISIIIDAAGIDAMQPRLAGGFSNKLVQMTK